MTAVSPTSWLVASWTLPSLRTSISSCLCRVNLPETTWQRFTHPASPPAAQHQAQTPALPSPFSSIHGSSCLKGTQTPCESAINWDLAWHWNFPWRLWAFWFGLCSKKIRVQINHAFMCSLDFPSRVVQKMWQSLGKWSSCFVMKLLGSV